MEKLYRGSATVDENLVLRTADDVIYQFTGQDMYATINRSIHPEDMGLFTEAMERLKKEPDTESYVTLRMQKNQEDYHWVALSLAYESFEQDGKPLIHVQLVDLLASDRYMGELEDCNKESEVLLSIYQGIVFSYDGQKDVLCIYQKCDGQQVELFQGSLCVFRQRFTEQTAEDGMKEVVAALCADIEKGKRVINYALATSFFSLDGREQSCEIKARTIEGVYHNRRTVGCIFAGNGENVQVYAYDTGIAVLNKKAIIDYAKRLMQLQKKVYLVILDLDNFKTVNDTKGHLYGDEVLNRAAEIVKDALCDKGVAGRIGGDEMMLLFDKVETYTEFRNILRTIRTNIEWAFKQTDEDAHVTCSMGAACYPENGETYEKIFQLADRMLYIAKKKGKNRYVIYIPEVHDPKEAPEDISGTEKGENVNTQLSWRDKAFCMERIIEEFLVRKIMSYEMVIKEAGRCFSLDEVILVHGYMKNVTAWSKRAEVKPIEERDFLNPEDSFFGCFDENHLFAMNGIYNIGGASKILEYQMRERNIESALFYEMTKHGRRVGYVIFAKSSRRQMWSEEEKILLGNIGKILEMSVVEK